MDCHPSWSGMIFAGFVIFIHVVGGLGTDHESPAKSCHPEEQQALLQFKHGLVFGGLESWPEGDGEDCCKWRGFICNNITGYVVQLHLTNLYHTPESMINGYSEINPALLTLKHLQYLNLGLRYPGSIHGALTMPEFLGSFEELRYLNLSGSIFTGEIPQALGNLSKLEVLDVSKGDEVYVKTLGWLSGLRALKLLNLNRVNLDNVGSKWMEDLGSLPSLQELYLEGCDLPEIRSYQTYSNFSSCIKVMDLRYNEEIGHSLHKWLLQSNISSLLRFDASASILSINGSLRVLDLANNLITGSVPELEHLHNIRELDLGNYPEGKLGGTANLRLHPVWGNSNWLEGALPQSLCHLKKLVKLSLRYNGLNSTIPECLGLLVSLETLSLEHNRLAGSLPSTFGQLSNLRILHLGSNNLEGQVLETHFQNLTQLQELDFSSNFLKLELSSDWIPPFEGLELLYLDSCVVGPDYPPWIRMQKSLARAGLSNTSIEGFLPHWFSESSCLFHYLDLSRNKIQGKLQNIYNCYKEPFSKIWDLSYNNLQGPIPSVNATFDFLSLSFNHFGGSIPSRLMSDDTVRYSIDLSNNQLIGEIPSSIGNCTLLQIVDLSRNQLSGQLPISMSNIRSLFSLHLSHNNLSGMLLPGLGNNTFLKTLDLGGNKLTGRIPKWSSQSFPTLRYLRLRSNFLSMEIPQELMSLTDLCVLDLAENHLSGTVPHSIHNHTSIPRLFHCLHL